MTEINPEELNRDLCPVMKTISVVGDKWVMRILRESFLGCKKFDDFQENLSVSKSVLSRKLQRMIETDLLYKKSYKIPGERRRDEYRLTGMGWDLIKVVLAMMEWGNEHLVDSGKRTLHVVERGSELPVRLSLLNAAGKATDWYSLNLTVDQK